MALLLHLREPLHEFAGRMGEKDIRAIMQFVLIALVILPILPDRTFGPYDVLNPSNTKLPGRESASPRRAPDRRTVNLAMDL